MIRRIGIFSGTFDPVHKGHIAFALEAAKKAKLDVVYFMLEPKPRRKEGITHYAHRLAMLELALKPHKALRTLEVADRQFSVKSTMPRLRGMFKDSKLYLLVGSDTVAYFVDAKEWPNADLLLKDFSLIVGLRGDADETSLKKQLGALAKRIIIINTDKKHASSRKIRQAVASNLLHKDSLKATDAYIKKHWIYTSVTGSADRS